MRKDYGDETQHYDPETVRCDGCGNDVPVSAVHENIDREEFDTICYNCTVDILALCRLDNINLPTMR